MQRPFYPHPGKSGEQSGPDLTEMKFIPLAEMCICIETVTKHPDLTFLAHLHLWTEICIPNMNSYSQLYIYHVLCHSWIASQNDFVIGLNVDPL